MEHMIHTLLPEIIYIIEIIGIIIIFFGSVKTFILSVVFSFTKQNYPIKQELASALALGLEYKMGAEILKTVLIRDMQEIWILGAIIILRAMLSLLIHFEMSSENTGRIPGPPSMVRKADNLSKANESMHQIITVGDYKAAAGTIMGGDVDTNREGAE